MSIIISRIIICNHEPVICLPIQANTTSEPSKIKSIETPTESAQTLRKGEKLELDFDFDAEESLEDEDVKVVIKDE